MKRTMQRYLSATVVSIGALLASSQAAAAVITLTPTSTVVAGGSIVTVDVGISAVGSGVALGAFDLDIAFNPTLLTPTAVAFGPRLGNPSLLQAFTSFSFATPGVVDFGEVSLLTSNDLLALQPGTFSLATLTFNAVASGLAGFQLLAASTLADGFGNALPITQPNAVPEPETVALAAIGLAVLMRARRRGRRGSAS